MREYASGKICSNCQLRAPLTHLDQITNSAPNHSSLGRLNGLAQTLSAAGRAAGPFLSGGIFSAATKIKPKGEALGFGLFGGIAFLGFLLSFGIKSEALETESDLDDVIAVDEEGRVGDDGDGGHDGEDDREEEERPLLGS